MFEIWFITVLVGLLLLLFWSLSLFLLLLPGGRGWALEHWDSHKQFGLKHSQVPGHQLLWPQLVYRLFKKKKKQCALLNDKGNGAEN